MEVERENLTDVWDEEGLMPAVKRTFLRPNFYLYGNLFYFVQAIMYCYLDSRTITYVDNVTGTIYVIGSTLDLNYENSLYIAAAVMHVVSALWYFVMWRYEGWPLWHIIYIPEWFNLVESTLCTASASLYHLENATLAYDPVYTRVTQLELAAAVLTICAALGWVVQWLLTYHHIPGRGFTFDDPDTWGLSTYLAGTLVNLVYEVQVHTGDYASSLYMTANNIFLANACIYLICNFRDGGWFWWTPTGGVNDFNNRYTKNADYNEDTSLFRMKNKDKDKDRITYT